MASRKTLADSVTDTVTGSAAGKMAQKYTQEITRKIKEQIPPNLTSRISQTVTDKIGDKMTARLSQTAVTAAGVAQMAAQTARENLDQVLIGLEHRGLKIKESAIVDLGQTVGRKVLERAETIRAQIAKNPMTPQWIRDTRIASSSTVVPEAAGSMTETTVSEPAADAQPIDFASQPETPSKKSKARKASGKKASAAIETEKVDQ